LSRDVCDNNGLTDKSRNDAMHLTFPTMLTLLRIALIPVLVVLFYLPYSWSNLACVIVFIIAAVTDIADGAIARSTGQTSRFGAFLDPVADKLMVTTALVLLVQRQETYQVVFAIAAAIIIGREITISALREWMSEIGESARVKVSWAGKLKTIFQMTAIGFLLYREDIGFIPVAMIGEWLLYTAAALTLWSMWNYLASAWPAIRDPRPGDDP
jgi:CDP-diacylglycerol--glycerol-3-phosphate 3-phosphatidyltransferase